MLYTWTEVKTTSGKQSWHFTNEKEGECQTYTQTGNAKATLMFTMHQYHMLLGLFTRTLIRDYMYIIIYIYFF